MTPEAKQPIITRRRFLEMAGATIAASVLAGCLPQIETPQVEETPVLQTPPSNVPTLESTPIIPPTETPKPTPTVEGSTIPGETLALGGAELVLVRIPGQELAQLVNAQDKGWFVVTGQDGNVNCFLGSGGERNEALAVLGQGPADYTWNNEVGVWESSDKQEGVIPNVTLPGAWNEETQSAGPLYPASFAFMYEKDGQYFNAILYSQETMVKFLEYLKGQGIKEENLVDELGNRGIELLPTGQALWAQGPAKRYNLEQNQTIERNPETGTFIVKDALGRPAREMITSWSEVKSAREVQDIGEWREAEEERYITPAGNEIRNGTSNAPEALDEGIAWAINMAIKEKGNNGSVIVYIKNGDDFEPFIITPETKIIIEVHPPNSNSTYLHFDTHNRFGYYRTPDDRLLIKVCGNAPRAFFSAMLGLQLPKAEQIVTPSETWGYHQIDSTQWPSKSSVQQLIDLWKPAGIDNIVVSPDSCAVGDDDCYK